MVSVTRETYAGSASCDEQKNVWSDGYSDASGKREKGRFRTTAVPLETQPLTGNQNGQSCDEFTIRTGDSTIKGAVFFSRCDTYGLGQESYDGGVKRFQSCKPWGEVLRHGTAKDSRTSIVSTCPLQTHNTRNNVKVIGDEDDVLKSRNPCTSTPCSAARAALRISN